MARAVLRAPLSVTAGAVVVLAAGGPMLRASGGLVRTESEVVAEQGAATTPLPAARKHFIGAGDPRVVLVHGSCR